MKNLLFKKTWNGGATFSQVEIFETKKSYIVETYTNVIGSVCGELMFMKTDELTKNIHALIEGKVDYHWFNDIFLENKKPYRKKIYKVS